MSMCIERFERADGIEFFLFFETGKFSTPVMMISGFEFEMMNKQIVKLRAEAIEEKRRQKDLEKS